ncbi:dipeptidyl aminopeptidase/acylaminoacyl peptidase [Sphingomonas kyeonggiensis]|uniref:Dipeptidyl aminopeptidase/acylaminoacyl peptidase n=1 Tax=Sphingomonas kyeonggiensis TaxID=1268553 RepID=A0A7W7NQQ8_9SPHN|nr:hypothetical protein [Sphingomonas kyeonggiensis]MBB4837031.1 dipeptidyl aminopeptidase/acylaminoacyl peptidase [Sphingomonas kyeonggiensis]
MSAGIRHIRTSWLIYAAIGITAAIPPAWAQPSKCPRRSITFEDQLRFTVFGEYASDNFKENPVRYSPDGQSYSLVTYQGDAAAKGVRFTLWVGRKSSDGLWQRPSPLKSRVTSRVPGISSVVWSADSKHILYLASDENASSVVELDTLTREERILASSPTRVVAFAASADGKRLLYVARPTAKPLLSARERLSGMLVNGPSLAELFSDRATDEGAPGTSQPLEVWVKDEDKPPRLVRGLGGTPAGFDLSVSPNGAIGLVRVSLSEIPRDWLGYTNPQIAQAARQGGMIFQRFDKVDLESGAASPLLNAPTFAPPGSYQWVQDGRAVVVAGTMMPLPGGQAPDPQDLSEPVAVEVGIELPYLKVIARGNWRLVAGMGSDDLTLARLPPWDWSARSPDTGVRFRRSQKRWLQADEAAVGSLAGRTIRLAQGQEQRPILVASAAQQRTAILLDPNGYLDCVRMDHVENIHWDVGNGARMQGGLFYPPGFRPGTRYPLIIQTHGWNPQRFTLSGAAENIFTARLLAAQGFVVAQVDELPSALDTTEAEGRYASAAFDALVVDLSRRHIIDPSNVGIIGYSRTGYHVRYALTNGATNYRAAAIIDGMDAGYFQYAASAGGRIDLLQRTFETMNGGSAFQSPEKWVATNPSFNLAKVRAPVRLVGLMPGSLLFNWEWFAGLKALDKDVEFIWAPDGGHDPLNPETRGMVQLGTAEWLRRQMMPEKPPLAPSQ